MLTSADLIFDPYVSQNIRPSAFSPTPWSPGPQTGFEPPTGPPGYQAPPVPNLSTPQLPSVPQFTGGPGNGYISQAGGGFISDPNSPFGWSVVNPGQQYITGYNPVSYTPNIPDYSGLAQSDPMYQQLQADTRAQSAADAAARAASIQRAVSQFGQVPEGLDQMAMGDITPETRTLADSLTQSGLSTTARMQQAHNDQMMSILQNLAARGGLQSGELGFQNTREGTQFLRNQFDSRQSLLDAIGGREQQFAQAEQGRQMALYGALQAAFDRAIALHPVTYTQSGGDPTYATAPGPTPQYQQAQQQAIQQAQQEQAPSAFTYGAGGHMGYAV